MIPATSLIAGFKHEIKEKVFGFGKNEKHEIRIISRNDKKSHYKSYDL
jgi:dihydropteroate synthase